MFQSLSVVLLLAVSSEAPENLPLPPPQGSVQPAPGELPPPPPDLPLPPPPPPDESSVQSVPSSSFARAPDKPQVENKQHHVSLTISPLLLLLPIAQVMGEFRVGDKFGAAAILGLGGVLDFFTVQVGGQFRYYLVGSFIHGLSLGAQLLTLVLTGEFGGSGVTAAGISLAPFVGYKIATNVGFTFDAQLGPDFVLAGATSTLVKSTAESSNGAIGLLFNLNVGWSF